VNASARPAPERRGHAADRSHHTPAILVVIPARGGSKGIPRKNVRALAGRPLIAYAIAIARASRFAPDVYVSSEDAEILGLARKLGAEVHVRDASLSADDTTLDSVVHDAYRAIRERTGRDYELVVTLQPTSPLLTTASLDSAIQQLLDDPTLDTVISATDDTHLGWTREGERYVPAYEARLNRQYLPPRYRETGGFLICRSRVIRPDNRIGPNVSLALLSGAEAIDIDTPDDWALAEWRLSRREVLFVVSGYPEIGLGHVFNVLTIASELVRHSLSFLVDERSQLAASTIEAHHYRVHRQHSGDIVADILELRPDVVVNDRLDTDEAEMRRLKDAGLILINFEDLGAGARLADLVINAIYPEHEALPNHYFGARYFCARPEFLLTEPRPVSERVERVLLTFGGTDENDLTRRVLEAIGPLCRERGVDIEVILGRGYRHAAEGPAFADARVHRSVATMSDHLRAADVCFTSAGRTVFEVALVGTPAIVLAQNEREETHFFASEEHGFMNLGRGVDATSERIRAAFVGLADDLDDRRLRQARMLANELRGGTARVVRLIERTIGGA
jgi:CMP-N-acetylneuraminic acid synthetase/spore coat polysaccharide biosynthesis predicted glycosyltransferase SpsG